MDVARLLEIEVAPDGEKFRGKCPYCDDKRSFTITPKPKDKPWGLSGCFKCGHSANCIQLVMNIKGFKNPREAAEYILENLGESTVTVKSTIPRNSTVPQSEARSEDDAKLKLLAFFDKLDSEHEAVACIGFAPDFAKRHKIGFIKSGIIGGTVAIPFRDENGELLGFIGLIDAKLPADFTPNVVRFPKTA
jgi:hypothetical protein